MISRGIQVVFVHTQPQVLENSTVVPLWLIRAEAGEEAVTSAQQTLLRCGFAPCSVKAQTLQWPVMQPLPHHLLLVLPSSTSLLLLSCKPASRFTLKSTAYMTGLGLTLHPSPLRGDGVGEWIWWREEVGEETGQGNCGWGVIIYERRILKKKTNN